MLCPKAMKIGMISVPCSSLCCRSPVLWRRDGGCGGGEQSFIPLCVPCLWVLCVTLALTWGWFQVWINTSMMLPMGLHRCWWVVLSTKRVMETVQVGGGVCVLPSLLHAEVRCSEVPVHHPTPGLGAGVRLWDLVPLGLFWALFAVDDLCGVTRHGVCPPWGVFPSATSVLLWKPQNISAMS